MKNDIEQSGIQGSIEYTKWNAVNNDLYFFETKINMKNNDNSLGNAVNCFYFTETKAYNFIIIEYENDYSFEYKYKDVLETIKDN